MTDEELKKLVLFTLGYKGNVDFTSEDDEIANEINFVYESLVKETLSKYRWGFCVKTKQLIERIEIIDNKYKYAYTLPADFITLINPYTDKNRNGLINDFELKNTFNANQNEVYIRYNARVETDKFPVYFIQYIKYKLGFELCYKLTGDTDLLQILQQKELQEYINAKNIDARQQPVKAIKDSPFYYERF